MMLRSTWICLVLFCIFSKGYGQNAKTTFTLLRELPGTEAKNKEDLPRRYLQLDRAALDAITEEAPSQLAVQLPLLSGTITELTLQRQDVTASNFTLRTSGGEKKVQNYQPGLHYQGRIESIPNSLAMLSVFEQEVMGTLIVGETVFTFGKARAKERPEANAYLLLNENSILASGTGADQPFCATSDEVSEELKEVMSRLSNRDNRVEQLHNLNSAADKVVNIYFECDYKMFQDRGNDATATANYVTAFFNVVKTLYSLEQINVNISQIFVWTTQDSYPTTSSLNALKAFGNKMGTTPFNGNIAQLLSTNTRNLGGIAWLDVLCRAPFYSSSQGTYVGPFSYTNITNNYAAFPTYSWTTLSVTHELGHNLGSPHTHSCSWPGGAIDNCYCPEGSCGFGPEPTNGGTVMSYCHLTGTTTLGTCTIPTLNPGVNLNLSFGTLPGNLIRDRVANATCLATTTSCALTASPTTLNFTAAGGSQAISITTPAAWTASSNATWLTLSSTSGSGNASVSATAQANTGTTSRTATITFSCGTGTQTVSVTQAAGTAACQVSTNPTTLSFTASSGSRNLTITSTGAWTATDNADWLSLSSTSGSRGITISVVAQANSGAARTAVITITCGGGTATVSVSQQGSGSGCTLTVSPTSLSYNASGGGQSVTITSGSAWTATDDASWLTLSSTSGSGNANITATAQSNTATTSRTATITISCGSTTRTISVTQQGATASGCTLSVNPTVLNFNSNSGSQSLAITASGSWTASDDASWLTLNSTSGSGNANISATVQSNTGGARTAIITLTCGSSTQTVSVSQAAASGGSCSLTVSPTSLLYGGSVGSQNVGITASGTWTVSSNVGWISPSSTAGSGNATLTLITQSNSSTARIGTVTITCGSVNRTVSVYQSGRRGGSLGSLPGGGGEEFDLTVAPNPVRDQLRINWQQPESAAVQLQLFDLHGRLIWQKQYNQLETGVYNENLEVQDYAPGAYILRLNTPRQPIVRRIIIE